MRKNLSVQPKKLKQFTISFLPPKKEKEKKSLEAVSGIAQTLCKPYEPNDGYHAKEWFWYHVKESLVPCERI